MTPAVDRPALIRKALRDLVAERGFQTAYVHYESKEELVYATYLELKAELSGAVLDGFDAEAEPQGQWRHILTAAYEFLAEEPERARFLTQLEESPYYEEAHARLMAVGDPLHSAARDEKFVELLVPLPYEVINALSFGVAVRLTAAGVQLKPDEVDLLVDATWRAVTKPE